MSTADLDERTAQARRDYWLVQRLTARETLYPQRGFDGYFAMDYMGSAEYEFGTPSTSLKAIRAGDIELMALPVQANDTTKIVYFVGDPKRIPGLADSLAAWLEFDGTRSKEVSHFPERFFERYTFSREASERVDAWWSFSCDVGLALDQKTAELLLQAFRTITARR